jgi:hypothetical protein
MPPFFLQMKKATLIVAAMLVGITLLGLIVENPNSTPPIVALSIPIEIALAWLCVFLVQAVKGETVQGAV